jgi:hypothetical protein
VVADEDLVDGRSPASSPGREPEIDWYWLSGWCFWRVAVLMAVMIWRLMHSSAKARKLAWWSGGSRARPCTAR